MKYTLLALLLCGGCATPISELREQADVCEKETPEHCQALWSEYMRRLEIIEKQLFERKCPEGWVVITQGRQKGCMSQRDVERWMGGI